MVHLDTKEIAMYGIGPVQVQAVENNVINILHTVPENRSIILTTLNNK
jgi:hypothetical protein